MLYLNNMPDEWRDAVRQKIGRNIRKKRVSANLNFNELYAETGIQRVTLMRWESGERSPRLDDLLWLCKCTGWRLSEILGGQNNGVGKGSRNESA